MSNHSGQQIVISLSSAGRNYGETGSEYTNNTFHMERFDLKKLNEVEVKRSIVLKSQIGSQLWKT
jgi:hypothetical protein